MRIEHGDGCGKLRTAETQGGEKNHTGGEGMADGGEKIDAKSDVPQRQQAEEMCEHGEQRIARRMRHTQGDGDSDQLGRIADGDLAGCGEGIQKTSAKRDRDGYDPRSPGTSEFGGHSPPLQLDHLRAEDVFAGANLVDDEHFGIANNVDEQDVPDLESDPVLNFFGHDVAKLTNSRRLPLDFGSILVLELNSNS